jgi:hypothetical protein
VPVLISKTNRSVKFPDWGQAEDDVHLLSQIFSAKLSL